MVWEVGLTLCYSKASTERSRERMLKEKSLVLFCLLATAVSGISSGCGPKISLQANRVQYAGARLQPLHIFVHQGAIDLFYAEDLQTALQNEARARGITATTSILTGIEMNFEKQLKAIEQRSKGVLIIEPIGGTSYYGRLKQIKYHARLFALSHNDNVSDIIVWKANLNTSSGAYRSQIRGRMEATAKQLIDHLIKQRLI